MGILEKFEKFEGEGARRYERGAELFSGILYRNALKDLSRIGLKGKVLEAGCGPGILAVEVAKRFSVDLTAFDISESMVMLAKKRAKRYGVRVDFRAGDVENDYFGEFDAVYSTFSLHHWNNPEKGLKNLWKMVKPGGVLYILDARKSWFFGHGLDFEEFSRLFGRLENAEKMEIRKRFPFMSSAVVFKK